MDKYEKVFLEQAKLGYHEFCSCYHGKRKLEEIKKRCRFLNNKFEFNESNIAKIENVNNRLKNKFQEAYKQAEDIERYLLDKINQKDSFVSDYEIEFQLSLFSEKKYAHIEALQGNSFFFMKPSISFQKKESSSIKQIEEYKEWMFEVDFNEAPDALKDQKHCFLLHDLYDHTYLSWEDIADIEEMWIEVLLRVQCFDILQK